jgi:hypothetical protein
MRIHGEGIMRVAIPLLTLPVMMLVGVIVGPRTQEEASIGDAVRAIEELDQLRSSLAGAFGEQGVPADRETFQQVCRPVGLRAREIAERNGWMVQQLAAKYRNPAHALDPEADRVDAMLRADPDLGGLWIRTSMQGREGVRYFRRIVVERACLACHGADEDRPDFIKGGYPDDRAFGFAVGDLRGLYAVFLPTSE